MAETAQAVESNQTFKRAVNRGLVLDSLRRGPASRLGLHKQTGIRLSTVGELVEEMLTAQLLVEKGAVQKAESERGRPEQLLALNLEGPFALSAYLDQEHLRVGRVNLAGELLAAREAPVASHEKAYKLVAQIAEEVQAVLPADPNPRAHCLGLGLSLPGLLDSVQGRVVLSAAFPGLEKGAPLAERLSQATGIPRVLMANAANSHLGAEKLYGALRGARDAILVILEPGQLGAAILSDGRVLRGTLESSAELGHVKIEADGPPCACGGKGCLEAFVNWKYLRARLIDKGRADLAAAGAEGGLHELWTSPRSACAELRGEALRRIGRAVGNLVNFTRPATVLFTGSLAAHERTVVTPLQAAIRREALRPFAERLDFRVSALGASAGLLGGASLVLQQVFKIPEVAGV